MKKLLIACLILAMILTTSVSALASEPTVDWLTKGQPDGWTEADATETLDFHTSSACYTLDNFTVSGGDTTYVMSQLVFDILIDRDSTTGEYIPWLAESYDLAADGSTLTFKLREDAWFTDGTQLTADDAIFSFARLKDDTERARLALVNTAESGFFAADRAIREYAERIWNL